MTDPILMKDLEEIDKEVSRRRKLRVPSEYAFWAMMERMAAIGRSFERDKSHQCAYGAPTDAPITII